MKKISSWMLMLAMCALVFSSCCTMRVGSVTKTKDPKTGEVLADLDIRTEKVTHNYRVTLKNPIGISDEVLKENAVFEALKKVGADVLVAPQFIVEKNICPLETSYDVTVTGYPAYYTNFRQRAQAEKLELRELKEGASYVVVKKSADNKDVEIDYDLIVAPSKNKCGDLKLDLNDTEVDHVVITKDKNEKNEKKKK